MVEPIGAALMVAPARPCDFECPNEASIVLCFVGVFFLCVADGWVGEEGWLELLGVAVVGRLRGRAFFECPNEASIRLCFVDVFLPL